MSRHQRPVRIGEAIEGLIDKMGLRERFDEATVIETWAGLAGTEINAVTQRVWLERGKLYVQVSNASWRQELHFNRTKWRARLNERLGRELVKEINFR